MLTKSFTMIIRISLVLFYVGISGLTCLAQTDCNDAVVMASRYFLQGKYARVQEMLSICDQTKMEKSDPNYDLIRRLECQSALEISKEKFRNGQLQEINEMLEPCAVGKYSRPTQRGVLALLIENNLFRDEHEKASDNYLSLLQLDPFYKINTAAPEMQYLQNRFETFPLTSYAIFGNLFPITRPVVSQSFSLPSVDVIDEDYKLDEGDLFSWTAGLMFDVNILNSNLYLRTGYALSSYYYRYTGEYENALESGDRRGPAIVTFRERSRWSQIPIQLKLSIVNRNTIIKRKFMPYVYGGIGLEFLHGQTAQLQSPTITFETFDVVKSIPTYGLADDRVDFNSTLMLGAGAAWRFKRIFFSVELAYQRMLNNVVTGENRNKFDDLSEVLNYVDDDFLLQKYGLGFSLGFFLFKSQQIPNID